MNTPQIELSGSAVAVLAGLVVGGVLLYKASRAASGVVDSIKEGVKGAADRVWFGPVDSAESYQELVRESRRGINLNPLTNNLYSVSPADLVPPGYRMNQYGGLEPIEPAYGANGSW